MARETASWKGPLVILPVFRQFVCCDLSACMLLFFMLLVVMMMMSRCIVCVFFITLPAYVILGSLNTISTMVELCNNGSIK